MVFYSLILNNPNTHKGKKSTSNQIYINSCRYGFNGKERDMEGIGGDGSTYDYGFRIYSAQIAKFLSVDPLSADYPELSTYQLSSNTPIWVIDLDGLEAYFIHGTWSSNDTWEQYDQLKEIVGRAYCNTDWVKHGWSGLNIYFAREIAAKDLVNKIKSTLKDGEPITLIGHSHGGNVAILAINMMSGMDEFKDKEINLVTINTPVRDDYQVKDEMKDQVDHFHIFDPQDPVAVKGGNDPDEFQPAYETWYGKKIGEGERASNKVPLKLSYAGEKGEAGLVFSGASNFMDYPHPLLTNLSSEKHHDSHNNVESWGP